MIAFGISLTLDTLRGFESLILLRALLAIGLVPLDDLCTFAYVLKREALAVIATPFK